MLRCEGFAEKKGLKPGMKEWRVERHTDHGTYDASTRSNRPHLCDACDAACKLKQLAWHKIGKHNSHGPVSSGPSFSVFSIWDARQPEINIDCMVTEQTMVPMWSSLTVTVTVTENAALTVTNSNWKQLTETLRAYAGKCKRMSVILERPVLTNMNKTELSKLD